MFIITYNSDTQYIHCLPMHIANKAFSIYNKILVWQTSLLPVTMYKQIFKGRI